MQRTQLITLFFTLFVTLSTSLVIPERRQVSLSLSTTVTFDPSTVTHIATEFDIPEATPTTLSSLASSTKSAVVSLTPTPTESSAGFDDSGEYIPPPPPDKQYYEDEGAGGDSTGFINVSIGAQAGIIIAIVLVGLAIMGGCVWFWTKKQKEWKAALERRRTLRASRIAAAKAANPGSSKKEKEGQKSSGLAKVSRSTSNGSSSVVSTEVTVPASQSQFDAMSPTEKETGSWLKNFLGKKR